MNIRSLQPVNIAEEKEKFFADFSYNPQFRYTAPIDESQLNAWGMPEERIERLSYDILSKTSPQEEGEMATEAEIETHFNQYLSKLPELKITLEFDSSLVVRAYLYRSVLTIHSPIRYRKHEVIGMLNHEIGTHALRKYNQTKQSWQPQNQGMIFRRTEEGLAVLNSQIANPSHNWRRTALSYLSVCLAQKKSFSELYVQLTCYTSPQKAWQLSVRAKRGISDTSRHGGFTKDLCYLAGVLDLYRWIIKGGNNPQLLYIGRIGIDEIDSHLNEASPYLLPPFAINRLEYVTKIQETLQPLRLENYV